MNKVPSKRVQEYWKPVFQAHETSGLSVAAFCAQRKMCSTSFYARRKQLRGAQDQKHGFVKLLPSTVRVSETATTSRPSVSIRTPNGYEVAVSLSGNNALGELFWILKGL